MYVKLKFIFCARIDIEVEALKICKRESIGTAQRIFGEEIVMIRVIRELPIPFSEVSRSWNAIQTCIGKGLPRIVYSISDSYL